MYEQKVGPLTNAMCKLVLQKKRSMRSAILSQTETKRLRRYIMSLDDCMIASFCLIDDTLPSIVKGKRLRSHRHRPKLAESEVIAVSCDKQPIGGRSKSCAGSLVYLFSKRPCSHNEQHEQHAGSFPVRRQSPLQHCGEMLSSQAHGATQSAIGKRVSHTPGFLALAVWFPIIVALPRF